MYREEHEAERLYSEARRAQERCVENNPRRPNVETGYELLNRRVMRDDERFSSGRFFLDRLP